jgi:hypothetical protein
MVEPFEMDSKLELTSIGSKLGAAPQHPALLARHVEAGASARTMQINGSGFWKAWRPSRTVVAAPRGGTHDDDVAAAQQEGQRRARARLAAKEEDGGRAERERHDRAARRLCVVDVAAQRVARTVVVHERGVGRKHGARAGALHRRRGERGEARGEGAERGRQRAAVGWPAVLARGPV